MSGLPIQRGGRIDRLYTALTSLPDLSRRNLTLARRIFAS